MARTYREIYNADCRQLMSVLLDWHIEAAQRRPRLSRGQMDAVMEETTAMLHEWQRTHDWRA